MSENPYESEKEEGTPTGRSSFWRQYAITVLGLGLVLILLVFLLLPARRTFRASERSREKSCHNSLKQIVVALQNYEADYGTWPPPYTVDEQGNRLHSWRTLLLPYVGEQRLYEKIDLSQPWDDPVNARVRAKKLEDFSCPNATPFHEYPTTYFAVVGDKSAFAEGAPKSWQSKPNRDKVIAIVDVPADLAIRWMEPTDIDVKGVLRAHARGTHQNKYGMCVAYADGHVETLPEDMTQSELRARLMDAN